MKRLIVGVILCALAIAAHANDWTYRITEDSFEGVEKKSAVLRGSGKGHNTLSIYNISDGERFVLVSADNINCYPRCTIRVKFDEASPENFLALGHRITSSAVEVEDYVRFVERITSARKVIFRLPFHDYGGDVTFNIPSRFDPAQWDAARKRQSIEELCEAHAVRESYSDCMARQGR